MGVLEIVAINDTARLSNFLKRFAMDVISLISRNLFSFIQSSNNPYSNILFTINPLLFSKENVFLSISQNKCEEKLSIFNDKEFIILAIGILRSFIVKQR
ncbi:MAG: hypothetical protein DRJ05_11315 [Bacteroidetes bacterium]|nr:MAG: hypothetical protein DRJ05_11315 [Bacteroidota bacterium]